MRGVGPAESGTAAGHVGIDPAVAGSGAANRTLAHDMVSVHPAAANRPHVSQHEHRAINVCFRQMRLRSSSVSGRVVAAFGLDQGSGR